MDKKIDDFHEKLVHRKFDEIYAESDPGLKENSSEQQFIEYLKNAREKLGTNLPRANVDSLESLLNTICRKLGKKAYQQESVEISGPPNYKSEIFRWVIYSNDEIRLLSYKY